VNERRKCRQPLEAEQTQWKRQGPIRAASSRRRA
jgi:hypothetical protein